MKSLLSLFTALLLVVPTLKAETVTKQRIGVAYDRESCELVYREIHNEVFEDGSIVSDKVVYEGSDGEVIADKTVSFKKNINMPSFNLIDRRSGYREGVRELTASESNAREVFVQNVGKTSEKARALDSDVQGVIDAGFDQFVIEKWDTLVSGERVKTEFLVPGFVRFFDFRIYRDNSDNGSDDGNAANSVRFILETDSFFLRALTDPIVVTYDASTKTLLKYVGVSNVRDTKGDNLDVVILFDGANQTPEC